MKTRVKTVILGPVVTVAGITAALTDIGIRQVHEDDVAFRYFARYEVARDRTPQVGLAEHQKAPPARRNGPGAVGRDS